MTNRGRPCSVASALEILGERWSLLVIRELFYGNHRFDAIARNTGAPRDVLTARLRSLEASGIVARVRYSERPPRYEYVLTEAGRELEHVLRALVEWGDRWAVDSPPVRFRHRDHPFHPAHVCDACGEPVSHEDVTAEVLAPGWNLRGPIRPPDRASAAIGIRRGSAGDA
ncbi:MAG TPA: helix-turn-helix domain-containing protein [Candidatus Dormibacteraeota bacterium]|nr:helix-turn-helix domain-containing protein [Candidatus Dormibacteraeota bacterium]